MNFYQKLVWRMMNIVILSYGNVCLIQIQFVSGGPEIDVILIGKINFIIIECKWNSKLGEKQGLERNQNQMQIREKWINTIGKAIYPSHTFSLVYVGKEKDLIYTSITWDELSMFHSLPHKNEFLKYLKLKK